jgi:hypothetical protein
MPSLLLSGVTHQRQLNARACWFTCLQMEVRYFENKAASSLADLRSPDTFPDMVSRFNVGSNPSWAEWRAWAQLCGFVPLDLTTTASGIYQFLGWRGPIIYSGTWGNTFDGHVVIIVGIDTDTDTLYIDDPLDGSAPTPKSFNTYMGQLTQTLTDNPLFVR